MDSIWAKLKLLEGTTLYTSKRKKPFDIIEVHEDGFVFQTSKGGINSFPRKRFEEICIHARGHSNVSAESLSKAGIVQRKRDYTYLPAIVQAVINGK